MIRRESPENIRHLLAIPQAVLLRPNPNPSPSPSPAPTPTPNPSPLALALALTRHDHPAAARHLRGMAHGGHARRAGRGTGEM